MWTYNETINSNELYHYGDPGMKWGVRRADRLRKKVDTLKNERKKIRDTKGVASKSFRKTSKKLFEARAKYKLQKSKNNNDSVGTTLAKRDLRIAKNIKKYGLDPLDSEAFNKVYGRDIKGKDREAIKISEYQTANRIYRGKKAVKLAMSVAAPIGVYALSKKVIPSINKGFERNAYRMNNNQIRNINKVINGFNKGLAFVNEVYGKKF